METQLICKACRTENDSANNYCTGCGASLEEAASTKNKIDNDVLITHLSSISADTKSIRKMLIFFTVLTVFGLAGVALFFLLK